MTTIDKIRRFIVSELVSGGTVSEISDSTPLIDSGIIDSFGIMAILGYLEDHFSIQVSGDDLIPENFSSIETIAGLVVRKNGFQLEA